MFTSPSLRARALAPHAAAAPPGPLRQCGPTHKSSRFPPDFLIKEEGRNRKWSLELLPLVKDAEGSAIHKFPLAQYHNSFHLFWIVKTLLQNCKVPYRAAAGSDATGFLVHLERRVFLLSEEFPLFSMYMWMIGGLLTSTGAGPPPAAAL
ncbi:Meiosis-specific protein MEI4 [Takifugu flavidus]|uniref:Meiosis-specific protein MEI4 n=1 Tax=Takifugu flavidus TaxID=433684 RepID=A0A5C6NP80_9TELE|nr:Meiosis-specific protein MEI4 [Takifugu flavidus]